jgi:hypothetical protein
VLADPGIQDAIATRDHTTLFLRLEYAGLLRRPRASVSQGRLETILAKNAADPAGFLRSRGLDATDATLRDESVRLASSIAADARNAGIHALTSYTMKVASP